MNPAVVQSPVVVQVVAVEDCDPTTVMISYPCIDPVLFGLIIPGIDNAAHVGGLIVGLAFGYLVSDLPAEETSSAGMWKALQVAAVLLVAVSFVMVGLHPRV